MAQHRRPTIIVPYGFAHFGKSLFWYTSESLFAFFLTEVCRIPPWHMAVILSISIAVNATSDVVVGTMLSRRMARLGDAVGLQVRGAVLSGACLVGFLASGLVPASVRLPYAIASLMLFRLAYALYDVPQNVILSLAGRSPAEHNTLSALRLFGSGCAGLLISAVFVPLLAGKPAPVQALDTAGLAAAMTVCAIATAVVLWARGQTSAGAPPPVAADTTGRSGLPAIMLLAANLLFSAGTAFFTRLEPYFAAYGASSHLTGAGVMIVIALGGLLAQPSFALLARRLSTWRLMTISSLVQMVGCGALYVALMRPGPAWGVLAPVVVASLIYGFGAGGTMMLSWVALTRVIARSGLSAPRTFGLFTFASKLGFAFSTFMLGQMLARGDYHHPWLGNAPLVAMMTFSPLIGATAYLAFAVAYKPGRDNQNP